MHGVTLSDLQYLVVVAEEGNFRRAADRCHITQPTLSAQIKKLEAVLGVTLIVRGKPLRLTPIGEKIVAEARRTLIQAQRVVDVAKNHRGPLIGELAIGITSTLCPYFLPHLAKFLRRDCSGLELRVQEDLPLHLLANLRAFSIDAAVLVLPQARDDLIAVPLFDEAFWFVCSPEHRLAELSEVTEDDLAESSLILLNEEHCPNEAILDACGSPERHVACLGADLRATSIETVRRMVAASGGCTLLPALSLLASPQSQRRLEIRPYKGRHDFRRVGLVWRKSCPRGEEMALLARLIRQNLPEGVRVVSEVAA